MGLPIKCQLSRRVHLAILPSLIDEGWKAFGVQAEANKVTAKAQEAVKPAFRSHKVIQACWQLPLPR
ncbi:MAG: hypothetical protein M5U34_33950 [Chloroflexi bacterium]|nr:hypothetical protein [Chloroflexota bacterium]